MNLNRQILRLAIPSIVSNITVPLLGLCDTAISGHLGSEVFLAAISVGTVWINALFLTMIFLRMGTTGLTAQAYGAGDKVGAGVLLTRGLLLAGGIGLLFIVAQRPLLALLSHVVGASPEVSASASEYFSIVILSAPAMLMTMVANGWFIGMQTSVQPMVIAVTTNVLNILLSLLAVFGLKLGFAGTAAGTCVANWLGLLLVVILLRRFGRCGFPGASVCRAFKGGGWGRFFNVNIYIFLRSFCIMGVTVSLAAFGARLGNDVLAGNAVMMQFFTFFAYFMDGFGFAAEALTGKAKGASDSRLLRSVIKRMLAWGALVTGIFALCYAVGASGISTLITDNLHTLQIIENQKLWVVLTPVCGGLVFILDGVFIGLTRTRSMMLSTLLGLVSFLVVAGAKLLPGAAGLWLAFDSYLLVRGVVLGCALFVKKCNKGKEVSKIS